jgi:hypothetical protein
MTSSVTELRSVARTRSEDSECSAISAVAVSELGLVVPGARNLRLILHEGKRPASWYEKGEPLGKSAEHSSRRYRGAEMIS